MLQCGVYSVAEYKTQLEAHNGCQKFHCPDIAFVFERHSFPQAWSVTEAVLSFLLDRIRAAPCEGGTLHCSDRGASHKDILIKGELCFLIKCIFKVKYVTVKREPQRMTYILDVENPFGKIAVSDYLEIWCSVINQIFYTCDSSVSLFLFSFYKIVQGFLFCFPQRRIMLPM